jgi:AcrR family transcriptional regulator
MMSHEVSSAARRLLQKQGDFSMAELAREAGTSRATLYRQVQNRESVLLELQVELPGTQEVILAAARQVFARAGFDAATLEDIAAEADVSAATVYRQFQDKYGLIRAFISRFAPRRTVAKIATEPSGNLRVDLLRIAETMLRFAEAEPDLLRLTIIEKVKRSPWAELFAKAPLRIQHSLARLLGHYDIAEPRASALAFGGMLLTAALQGGDPAQAARFVTRVFLDGAR